MCMYSMAGNFYKRLFDEEDEGGTQLFAICECFDSGSHIEYALSRSGEAMRILVKYQKKTELAFWFFSPDHEQLLLTTNLSSNKS